MTLLFTSQRRVDGVLDGVDGKEHTGQLNQSRNLLIDLSQLGLKQLDTLEHAWCSDVKHKETRKDHHHCIIVFLHQQEDVCVCTD